MPPEFNRHEEQEQPSLFNIEPDWREEWEGMPEYRHKDLQPKYQLIVSFDTSEDIQKFARLVGQKLTRKTQSIWYPEKTWENVIGVKRYADKDTPTMEEHREIYAKSMGEALGRAGAEADRLVIKKIIEKEEPKKHTGPSAFEYLMARKTGTKDPDLEGK